MSMKFTNNATSTLASGINSSVTSLSVASGQGALFPTLGGSDYFYCTLANVAGTVEIVKVTARSTDTFTIVRGQDGTTATTWVSGDTVELRLVAASLNDIPKLDEANSFTTAPTFGTALAVTSGGTGGTSASAARTALGLAIGTDVQANLVSTTNIKSINGSSILGSGDLTVGGTPAGSTGQVQYNNAGTFGAVASGTSGQVLTSAGTGAAPTWVTPAGGAGAFIAFSSTGGF